MNILKNDELFQMSNKDFIICSSKIEKSISYMDSKKSIIYFTDDFKEDRINVLDNKINENIFVISKKCDRVKNEKLICATTINNSIIQKLSTNTLILVEMNDNYDYVKFIVKNINKLFEKCKKYNKVIGYKNSEINIMASIVHNNSVYLEDLLNAFRAINMPTKREKYEFIYDTVCDFLDNNFYCKNICDFRNDRCIASRAGEASHETMGCCYSFDYAGLFDLRIVKNVKVCHYLQNRKCSTKNIACKLFTCRYLKKMNISFDVHKILLLECFFSKKQHEIIKSNFFRTREEILDKLLEKNNDTYLWYYMFRKYMIKN